MKPVLAVFQECLVPIRADDLDSRQAQLLSDLLLIDEGFRKKHLRVDEKDGRRAIDGRQHVQEHHRFRAERGDHSCVPDLRIG